MKRILFLGASILALAGCSGSGPSADAIIDGSAATIASASKEQPYVIVAVTEDLAPKLSKSLDATPHFFAQSAPAPVIIGPGDAVQISIVSSSETGFVDFTSASLSPISTTTLPAQTLGSNGTINMPPIGRLIAAGKTVEELETDLEQRLGAVLVDPSVIVELVRRESARAKVVGAVAQPGAVALAEANTRLLDVLLAAGGPTGRSEDMRLSLSRNGVTHTISLRQLYEKPSLNITVRSDDVIALELADQKITILGATGNQTLRFNEQHVSLAEVLAESGGLDSERSRRTGVFLYRKTPRSALEGLSNDIGSISGDVVNAVYQFDFSDPSSLFTANAFRVADGDLLYVADSVNSEVANAISLFTNFVPAPIEFSRDAAFGN